MLKTKEEVKKWLDKYNVKKYTINEDLTVDVHGNVSLYNKKLKSIDIQFNKIKGGFNCSGNKLTSLKGCPKEVIEFFNCQDNELISLEGCPKEVGGFFYCQRNELTNLDFLPEKVDRNFWCDGNQRLGDLQEITDLNQIKIIVNKEKLELLLKDKLVNKELISKLKI